jgi:hypothetical protein
MNIHKLSDGVKIDGFTGKFHVRKLLVRYDSPHADLSDDRYEEYATELEKIPGVSYVEEENIEIDPEYFTQESEQQILQICKKYKRYAKKKNKKR